MRKLYCLFFLFLAIEVNAQISQDFTPSFIKDGSITAIERYASGKLLVAGDFAQVGSSKMNNFFRLNADGSTDNSFNFGVGLEEGRILDILIQDDGKLVIAGDFVYQGIKYLVRLNADGSLDPTFNTGAGPSSTVFTVLKRIGGGYLIQGYFSEYDRQPIKYVAAINEDGSLNTTFDKNAAAHLNTTQLCGNGGSTLAQQSDGKIIYSDCGGKGIVRLNADGTPDNTFNLPANILPKTIFVLSLPNNKVVAGGTFDFEGSNSVSRIVRFNSDGSKDATFTVHTPGNNIGRLDVDPSGKILFVEANFSFPSLRRLNANGTVDGTLSVSFGNSSGIIRSIICDPDGSIWVGGKSLIFASQVKPFLKLTSTGAASPTTLPFIGTSADIYDATVDKQGRILVYGDFISVNGQPVKNLVRLLPSGLTDGSFSTQITGITKNTFDEVAGRVSAQADGKVLVTAQSIAINTVGTKKGIIRLNTNGSYDASFAPTIPIGTSNNINTLLVRDDDKILIAGDFDNSINGRIGNVAILNANGSTDSFSATLDFYPRAAIFLSGNKIMIGGGKYSSDGTADNDYGRLLRLNADGTVDNTFKWLEYSERNFSNLIPFHITKTAQGLFVGGGKGSFASYEKDLVTYLDDSGNSVKTFVNQNVSLAHINTSVELVNGLLMYTGIGFVSTPTELRTIFPSGKPFGTPIRVNNRITKIVKLNDSKILVFGSFSRVNKLPFVGAFSIDLSLVPTDKITNLAATPTSGEVNLSWSYATQNAMFEIYRSTKPDQGFIKIARLSATTYVDTKPVLGAINYYKIRIVNIAGDGPFSDAVSASLPATTTATPVISGTSLPLHQIQITWGAASHVIEIQRTEDLEDLTNAVSHYSIGRRTGSSIFTQLQPNKEYYFRARVESDGQYSQFSDFIKVVTGPDDFSPPYDLTVSNAGLTAMIHWSDNANAEKYELWRNSSGYFERVAILTDTFFVDNVLRPNTYHYYAVRSIAKNEGDFIYSAYSQVVKLLTPQLNSGSWTARSNLASARADAVSFSIGNYGYLGLGYNGAYLNDFYKFDPVNNSWTPINAFPGIGRSDAIAFVINGKAYVGGGTNGSNNGLKDFYEYDPVGNSWKNVADFPNDEAGNSGTMRSVAFAEQGLGYVTMITRTGGINTREVWAYSPILNTWSKKADFPGSLHQNGIAVIKEGKGYVGLGGVLSLNEQWWMYDPQANTWTQKRGPIGLGSKSAVGLNYNGYIYTATGNISSDFVTPVYSKAVNFYHSEGDFWTQSSALVVPDLSSARSSATGFIIADRMYIGTGYNGTYLSDFYEYKSSSPHTVGAVADLKASYVSDGVFDLSWKFDGYLASSLELELAENPSTFSPIAIIPVTERTYRLTGLQPNKKYYARIRGKSIDETGAYVMIQFYTKAKPSAPTSLAATSQSHQSIKLSWMDNSSNNETGYEVWRTTGHSLASYIRVAVAGPNTVQFIDNTCLPEMRYYYKINAVNEAGASALTSDVNAATGALPPPVPQNLKITSIASTSITISWSNESIAFIEAAEVYYKFGNNSSLYYSGSTNQTSFTLTNLTPVTQYTIMVKNRTPSAVSAYTPEVTATTLEPRPGNVHKFTGVALSDNSIELSWTFSALPTDDGFVIQRSDNSTDPFVTLETVKTDVRKFTDNSVEALKTYRYRMFAFSNAGSSDTTAIVSIWAKVIPKAPSGLVVSQDSLTRIFIKWTDNSNNEDGFIIQTFDPSTNQFITIDTVAPNVVSYLHEHLLENRLFKYKVIAFNEAGKTETAVAEAMNHLIVGNEILLSEGLQIYPNPGKGIFNIELNSNNWYFEIFDVTGTKIYGNSSSTSSVTADLSKNPDGIYYFKVKVNNDVTVRKVVKLE